MPRHPPIRPADLRGAARLVTDAATGLTDLVEAMHARIALVPGVGGAGSLPRTGGLTGLVYKCVRGVTRVVGGSVDAFLALLATTLAMTPSGEHAADEDAVSGTQREAIIAAVNGVLGDHLVATRNPLATRMTLRHDGRVLARSSPGALNASLPPPACCGPRLLVLIHGLCMNDLQWLREGHDHGAALAAAGGYTPVYLRYNSGLHISTNGRELALQLESLLMQWPQPLERVVLLGHSMGGLVARSAMHHGQQEGLAWTARVDDMCFLGTPHHGAPLERAGHWVDLLLGAAPYAGPFARLGKLRSAGITDLRHGSLLDEDWEGADRFARLTQVPRHLPLPQRLRCYALAGSTGQRDGDLKDRLLGDGLVPLDSALGRHRDPARCLSFAVEHQSVCYGVNHMELLNHPAVAAQLQRWLA